jgi:hypothetical protein
MEESKEIECVNVRVLKGMFHKIEMGCWQFYGWRIIWRWNYDRLWNLSVISCFLRLNFTFLRGIARSLLLCMLLGQPSCKCIRDCWQPFGKFITGGQRILAIIRHNCYRVLKCIGNPLMNSSKGIGYPLEQLAEGWITCQDICKRVALLKKKGTTFLQ